MATLKLEIVTPEAKTYSEDVDMVFVPGTEGELGILPKHIPLHDHHQARRAAGAAPGAETRSWRWAKASWKSRRRA